MKKFFNMSIAMLIGMAMTVTFTACNPDEETTSDEASSLMFLCDNDTIAAESIYISSQLKESFGDIQITPDVKLIGNKSGSVVIMVAALNQTQIDFCMSFQCRTTSEDNNYAVSATSDIVANTPLTLDIHTTVPQPESSYRSEALITAYYEGEEDNAINFTLVMTNAKGE